MTQKKRRHKVSESTFAHGRLCRFNISDLVRIDFVFPYGRVAATREGLMPEPFDRDADFATDPREIEDMKNRIMSLFQSASD